MAWVFAMYSCIYVQKYLIDIYIINIAIILINCLHCHNNWQLQPLTKGTGKALLGPLFLWHLLIKITKTQLC